MSVAMQLGFTPDGPEPVDNDKWNAWCAVHPCLERFAGIEEMWRVIQESPIDDADEWLWVWAQLAAEDGGNDLEAASWLAWALVPGASALGPRMRGIENLDQLVAAALWVEVRTYPWRTRHHVAGNVMFGVRARVFGEVGRSARRDQRRRFERRLVLVPNYDGLSAGLARAEDPFTPDTPREELLAVLDWACADGVISEFERRVLLALVEAWAQAPRTPQARAAASGFCGNQLSDEAGALLGITGRSVRRITRRCLDALAGASGRYLESA